MGLQDINTRFYSLTKKDFPLMTLAERPAPHATLRPFSAGASGGRLPGSLCRCLARPVTRGAQGMQPARKVSEWTPWKIWEGGEASAFRLRGLRAERGQIVQAECSDVFLRNIVQGRNP